MTADRSLNKPPMLVFSLANQIPLIAQTFIHFLISWSDKEFENSLNHLDTNVGIDLTQRISVLLLSRLE